MAEDSETLKLRIKQLRKSTQEGDAVIYVMSRDQRVRDNHALLCAQKHALAKGLPLAVVFCLRAGKTKRAREQYQFMLDGLREVEKDLQALDIPLMMVIGDPEERLGGVFHHVRPDAVYFDFNPLRGPQKLLDHFVKKDSLTCSVFVVDTHNIVPVWQASSKFEVGAYTLRPKISKMIESYLIEPEQIIVHPHKWAGRIQPLSELAPLIDSLLAETKSNGTQTKFKSGEKSAAAHLETFIYTGLEQYGQSRNDPSLDGQSDLSAYLHFGQISSLRVALRLREVLLQNDSDLHILQSTKMPQSDGKSPLEYSVDALLEELIVRKELADNYCFYVDQYDTLEAGPTWAKTSLDKHRTDLREVVYTLEELENARTHDGAWNAAQMQMKKTGKIHGYMRMYWAKKVLEWSPPMAESNVQSQMSKVAKLEVQPSTLDVRLSTLVGAEWAIEVLKYLNDHYSLDGGDPNGYAGILWSVCGVHDRPWQERDIFGVVRYMNYGGLKRKFDIEAYEQKWLKP